MPWREVECTNATPKLFSPAASGTGITTADLYSLVDVEASTEYTCLSLGGCKFGAIFSHKHAFAYLRESPGTAQWVYGLHHFLDSAVCAVPWTKRTVPGSSLVYVELELRAEPCMFTIFELPKTSKACVVVPHSWACQWNNAQGLRKAKPATRLFMSGEIQTLQALACNCAWWSMPKGPTMVLK